MSWVDDIERDLRVVTGEGSEFNFLWRNAKRSISYNLSTFEFPNVQGTLVRRELQKGNRFPIEFYIQGAEHLEESNRFEIASQDRRPWTLFHPYYGRLTVQPTTLEIDNTNHNVTKITGTLIETIQIEGPQTSVSLSDSVLLLQTETDDITAQNFANNNVTVSDANLLAEENTTTLNNFQKLARNTDEINSIRNAFGVAETAITNATQEPLQAMKSIQSFISTPVRFQQTVQTRFAMLKTEFTRLLTTIDSLVSTAGKFGYEAKASSFVASFASTAVLPTPEDYQTRVSVISIVDDLADLYEQYVDSINTLQGDDYFPNPEALNSLSELVNLTTSELFVIANDAQQERVTFLDRDYSLVELAHRFYGIDDLDDSVNRFVTTNDITMDETLLVPKGRRVIWYV